MLVILRMNRDFMKFMREHYNYLTKQTFGRTDGRRPGPGVERRGEWRCTACERSLLDRYPENV